MSISSRLKKIESFTTYESEIIEFAFKKPHESKQTALERAKKYFQRRISSF